MEFSMFGRSEETFLAGMHEGGADTLLTELGLHGQVRRRVRCCVWGRVGETHTNRTREQQQHTHRRALCVGACVGETTQHTEQTRHCSAALRPGRCVCDGRCSRPATVAWTCGSRVSLTHTNTPSNACR
eukprot:3617983-Rhodomonas_salina.1